MGGQQSIKPIRAADRRTCADKGFRKHPEKWHTLSAVSDFVSRRAQADDRDHGIAEKGTDRRRDDPQSWDQGETCRDLHTGSGSHGDHGEIRFSGRLQDGIGHGKQTDEKGRRRQYGEQRGCGVCGIGAVEQGQNRF